MRSYSHVTKQVQPGKPGTVVITTTVQRSPWPSILRMLFMLLIIWITVWSIMAINVHQREYNACVISRNADLCEQVR